LDGRRTLAEPRRVVLPAIGFLSVAAGFFVWSRIQTRYFYRAADLAAQRGEADPSAASAELALRAMAEDPGNESARLTLVERIASQVRLPDLPAFSALADAMPLAAAAAPVLALAATAAFFALRRPRLRPAAYVLLPLVALLCGFHLFNLALLATLGLAFVRREGVRACRAPEVVLALALIAVSFAAWLAVSLRVGPVGVDGGDAATAKEAIRALLNYPSFFVFWGFPREYPMASI